MCVCALTHVCVYVRVCVGWVGDRSCKLKVSKTFNQCIRAQGDYFKGNSGNTGDVGKV